MTPDNPQERLKALIEETERALLKAGAFGPDPAISNAVVRLLLDAASRSIPAGEDAELVRRLRKHAVHAREDRHMKAAYAMEDAAARLSSISSELEQVRALSEDHKQNAQRWYADKLAAEARLEKAAKLNRRVLTWAERRCPCRNDEPNPCPLCGASVENLEPCKSAENTVPPDILGDLRAARPWIEGGE